MKKSLMLLTSLSFGIVHCNDTQVYSEILDALAYIKNDVIKRQAFSYTTSAKGIYSGDTLSDMRSSLSGRVKVLDEKIAKYKAMTGKPDYQMLAKDYKYLSTLATLARRYYTEPLGQAQLYRETYNYQYGRQEEVFDDLKFNANYQFTTRIETYDQRAKKYQDMADAKK